MSGVVTNQPYYRDFANNVCAFVFDVFPELTHVNGKAIADLRTLGTDNITCKIDTNNLIDFKSVNDFGSFGTVKDWSIPTNDLPATVGGVFANYIGFGVFGGKEKIAIYGEIDSNGYIKNIPGSLYDGISLTVSTYEPNGAGRGLTLTGCRLTGNPTRPDCPVVINEYDYRATQAGVIVGDIPIIFLGNNQATIN